MTDKTQPVRTREEQIKEMALVAENAGCIGDNCFNWARMQVNAAEQRGYQKRVSEENAGAIIYQIRPKGCPTWMDVSLEEFHKLNTEFWELRIVYTHPANVAALDARIAELEAENEKLKQPQWFNYAEDGEYCGGDLNELHNELEIPLFSVSEAKGSRTVQTVWFFHDGINCYSFATETEATKAAEKMKQENNNDAV